MQWLDGARARPQACDRACRASTGRATIGLSIASWIVTVSDTLSRVILIVMDSVGVGELPDADRVRRRGQRHARQYRAGRPAAGADAAVARAWRVSWTIGGDAPPAPVGAFGRMAEASPGKDSVTGHWEMTGIVLDGPFPTFPHGFPADLIARVRTADRPAVARQHRRVRHGHHRRARAGAHAHRRAHRLHVGRQRVPDRRA